MERRNGPEPLRRRGVLRALVAAGVAAVSLVAAGRDGDEAPRSIVSGEASEVRVDPESPVARLVYRARTASSIFVSATSTGVVPRLVVEPPGAPPSVAKETRGNIASVTVAANAGQLLRITVAAAEERSAKILVLLHEVPDPSPEDAAALAAAREELGIAADLFANGEADRARARVGDVLDRVLAIHARAATRESARAVFATGVTAFRVADRAAARRAWEPVATFFEGVFPPNQNDVLAVKVNLAVVLDQLGEVEEARRRHAEILAALEGAREEADPDLLSARQNLASAESRTGDLAAAREQFEIVLRVHLATLGPDALEVAVARVNVAGVLRQQGDLAAAVEHGEAALAVMARDLPPDDRYRVGAMSVVAAAYVELGRLEEARQLQAGVLEVRERTMPAGHPDLAESRMNLARTLRLLGDDDAGTRLLIEAYDELVRHAPDDLPTLQRLRVNLASVLSAQGDVLEAKDLLEQALAVFERRWDESHPELLNVRGKLADVLLAVGDVDRARELMRRALASASRALPDDDHRLRMLRLIDCHVLHAAGAPGEARRVIDRLLAGMEGVLPEDHADWIDVLRADVRTSILLGDMDRAIAAARHALRLSKRRHADDSIVVLRTRLLVGGALSIAGRHDEAEGELAAVVASFATTQPPEAPLRVAARAALMLCRAGRKDWDRAGETGGELARDLLAAIRVHVRASSRREVERLVADQADSLSDLVWVAAAVQRETGDDALDRWAFRVAEAYRSAGLRVARTARVAAGSPNVARMRRDLARASSRVSELATSDAEGSRLVDAVAARDALERDLARASAETGTFAALALDVDVAAVAGSLPSDAAAVAYLDYHDPSELRVGPPAHLTLAWVVRPDASYSRVELGPTSAIREAVGAWRDAILSPPRGNAFRDVVPFGVDDDTGGNVEETRSVERDRGEHLRALVFDPVRSALGGARRIVCVPDGALHLVPLDALPLADGVVGDRWSVSTQDSLLEPAERSESAPAAGADLLAVGGVDYDHADGAAGTDRRSSGAPAASLSHGVERAWFPPIEATLVEANQVAAVHERAFPSAGRRTLAGRSVTADALREAAASVRFLHIATHGYFSERFVPPASPLATTGSSAHLEFGGAAGRREGVRRLSPMTLCGLALSGANEAADSLGRVRGVLTAEDLSAFDLEGCELAVLSACESDLGVARAVQGVASLRRALRMAGARRAITSLWKVDDDATAVLMTEFYGRLWLDGSSPADALWAAKCTLRDARRPSGEPVHRTADWAAWVLAGDPR